MYLCVSCGFPPPLVHFFSICLFYTILVYLFVLVLDACFLMIKRKGMDLSGRGGGEDLGGVGRRETIIRIECMKKKTSYFQLRNKREN